MSPWNSIQRKNLIGRGSFFKVGVPSSHIYQYTLKTILWTPFFLEILFHIQLSLVSLVKDLFFLVLKKWMGLSSFQSLVGNGGPKGNLLGAQSRVNWVWFTTSWICLRIGTIVCEVYYMSQSSHVWNHWHKLRLSSSCSCSCAVGCSEGKEKANIVLDIKRDSLAGSYECLLK